MFSLVWFIAGPAGVGAEVVALFLTGWSMHHYYLDSKIWRVSRDPYVAKSLGL